MSLDQQLALARTMRGESSHLSKAARQVVPPFLQKLYEIVNDPRNDELIRWSESGDSFYVLNHERFAREVLGRWFKHQKFTSFVRQLNMYGFHKIPHLQQGVLKSDTDTEPWNFEHPHFHRGQPDLLCLIQRKKQPANSTGDEPDIVDSHQSAPLAGNASQVLDINSIVNGIAAIKRHQQAISADLNALKKSNDLLWEEATLTRQRHDKHQDTINRILKFLAGVFGNNTESINKNESGRPPSVVPRARQRLLIGDGGFPKGKSVEIADVDEDDEEIHMAHPQEGNKTPLAGQTAAVEPTVESPMMSPSPSAPPSEPFSTVSVDSTASGYTAHPVTRPSEVLSRTSTSNNSNFGSATEVPTRTTFTQNAARADATILPTALTSFTPNAANASYSDNIWQTAFQQLLNNPLQMQRLMQAIAAQNSNIPPPDNSSMIHSQPSAQIAPYDQTYNDYNRYRNDLPVAAPPSQSSLPMLSAISNDAPPLEPLLHENNARLQKTYRDAVEIEADMDVLQHSLNSLIHDLGMDPQVLIAQAQERDPPTGNIPGALLSNGGHANGVHANGFRPNEMDSDALMLGVAANGHQEEAAPDLFLESLLNGMSPGTDGNMEYSDVTDHFNPSARIDGITVADASTEQLAAFLDEVSDTASPHVRSPEIKTTPAKRKSDVAGLAPSIVDVEKTAAAGPKSKRKR